MTFLFRVEAGSETGLGHLSRSLSLAAALRHRGAECSFALNLHTGSLNGMDRKGFSFTEVTAPPGSREDLAFTCELARRHGSDAVVVDSRFSTERYLRWLVEAGLFVVWRDDLGAPRFPCQIVLNGNADAEHLPYDLGPPETRFMLGPRFIVLPPEFWEAPKRKPDKEVRNLLILTGGTDSHNVMPSLIQLCDDLPIDFTITAVIGPFFCHGASVRQAAGAARKRVVCIERPPSLFGLMREADLAISGGGQTLYELACVGCPTVAVEIGPDQTGQMQALEKAGCLRIAGKAEDPHLPAQLREVLLPLLGDLARRTAMTKAGQTLVDGQGALRVAQQITWAIEVLTP